MEDQKCTQNDVERDVNFLPPALCVCVCVELQSDCFLSSICSKSRGRSNLNLKPNRSAAKKKIITLSRVCLRKGSEISMNNLWFALE